MLRRSVWLGGLLLLTGALFLGTASPAAAHGGGGHGGGGHGGGGGGHGGGGFHGGGFHGGGFGGGLSGGGLFRGNNLGLYGAFRGYYGGSGGYYPYAGGLYGGYSTYPSYYGAYPNYSALYPNAGNGVVTQPNIEPPPAATDTTAHINLRVPPDAQVWFGGSKTNAAGPIREFQSPPLEPGSKYSYEVQARWMDDGKEVTQSQKVTVWAGAQLDVRFPVPPPPPPEK